MSTVSSLATGKSFSLNKCNPRNGTPIRKITIHHSAGGSSAKAVAAWFQQPSSGGSANYICDPTDIICNVPEEFRAWTSSSAENDYQAITIELVNDGGAPHWHVADKTIARCIELCIDVCKRYKIERIDYTGDKSGNLTMHKWFAATSCPGPYLETLFPTIAEQINSLLGKKAGDVNGDGKINAKDVTAIMKALVSGQVQYLKKADINGDGKVNAKDVTALMKQLVGSQPTPSTVKFAVGDKVRVRVGVTTFSDGTPMASFVTAATLYVRAVEQDGTILLVSTEPTKQVYTGRILAADAVKVTGGDRYD